MYGYVYGTFDVTVSAMFNTMKLVSIQFSTNIGDSHIHRHTYTQNEQHNGKLRIQFSLNLKKVN